MGITMIMQSLWMWFGSAHCATQKNMQNKIYKLEYFEEHPVFEYYTTLRRARLMAKVQKMRLPVRDWGSIKVFSPKGEQLRLRK